MEPLSLNLSFLVALFFGPAPVVAVAPEEDAGAFYDVVAFVVGVVVDDEDEGEDEGEDEDDANVLMLQEKREVSPEVEQSAVGLVGASGGP